MDKKSRKFARWLRERDFIAKPLREKQSKGKK